MHQQKRIVEAAVGPTIADGLACRVLPQDAVDVLVAHVDDVVAVTDAEVAAAIRLYYRATHNVVLGLPLTGSNIDTAVLRTVLAESTP